MAALINAGIVSVDCRDVDFFDTTLLNEGDGGVTTDGWPLNRVRGKHIALRLRLSIRLLRSVRVNGGLLNDLQPLDRRA